MSEEMMGRRRNASRSSHQPIVPYESPTDLPSFRWMRNVHAKLNVTFSLRRLDNMLPMVRALLEQTLRHLEKEATLTDSINNHPNDLIWLMFSAWAVDGRAGGMKQDDMADVIRNKCGTNFDRNSMQCVLKGKILNDRKGAAYYVLIPTLEEMRAIFEVVFENWVEDGPQSYDPPIDLVKVAENAVQAIAQHDWYGRNTDLRPLLAILTSMDVKVTLKSIEWLIANKIHLKSLVTIDDVRAALVVDKKLSG